MKILLINPSCVDNEGRDLYSAHLLGPLFTLQPTKRMTLGLPLALPTLAALTPAHHDVRIIDEEIEEIDFSTPADLVGITAMTFKATRAYEIAKKFRSRNVTVVIGGIHASMTPEDVAPHADAVVVGEAESLWPNLLADFETGELKPEYRAADYPDLSLSPVPRYDLVKNRSYIYSYLQTTRGCPYSCDFCTVTEMSGRKLRRKSVDQVIVEVDHVLKQSPLRPFRIYDKKNGRIRRLVAAIAFIDDNFAVNREHALNICRALRDYQDRHDLLFIWYTQVNFDIGFDVELLKEMAESGCRHLFIGFENLDPDVLQSINKDMNDPGKYREAIINIEQAGMQVVYSTIFDEHASKEGADQLVKFVEEQDVFHVLLNILTPYPGTKLRKTLEKDGRILLQEPHRYNIRNVVYRPKTMSTVDLETIYMHLCRELYRFDKVYARALSLSNHGDRFIFPSFERLLIPLLLIFSGVLLVLQRRLKIRSFLHLSKRIGKDILLDGSLLSFEVLLASCDYHEFLDSEMARMGKSGGGRKSGLALTLTRQALQTNPLTDPGLRNQAHYLSFLVTSQALEEYGIEVPEKNVGRPLLILGGTSLSLDDRNDFLGHLLCSGFEVAGIQNPLGGVSHITIDPVKERPAALNNFLLILKKSGQSKGVDIIAQSYSAFETVRVLSENPEFSTFVKSIVLINPPGFDPDNNVPKHVLRFLGHVLSGYTENLTCLLNGKIKAPAPEKNEGRHFSRREIKGLSFWIAQTFANPVRTIKEIKDITGFRIEKPLKTLIKQGIPIFLFLQRDDKIVLAEQTEKEAIKILPKENIKVVPGGHNDLFFQPWQREEFCRFLNQIRIQFPVKA
jgi:radical SAM superfamily enzyme YgiQ (UPF0313 family)